MVKKIKYLSVFLLLVLFISKNSIAEDNPDLNPDSSGGAKFVSIPKNAAKKFIKDKGFREGLNKRADGSHLFITIGQGTVTTTADNQAIHDARYNAFRTAMQIRTSIEAKGWKNVVAFQTRNPMHRAHEELCRMAGERVDADGILIHMLLGKLKPGDIPADVRDTAIRTMVDHYFPKDYVMITGYGFDMLYAGPREALLHAVFRQNCGCSYLIVGRDHAGVGDFYGAFDAQDIFESIPKDALEIKIFKADHTAYSKKLNKVVMMRDVEDHTKEDFVILSGTKVREMLSKGESLPKEFARPEVAEVLMKHYMKEQ